MGFRVVCISRAIAAGGESVGRAVAQALGFRYVDEEIIQRAARQAHVEPGLVAATEQRQKLLQRLLDRLPTGSDLAGTLSMAAGVALPTVALVSNRAMPEDMRILIRAAIHQVAEAGQAVIVAHAASMALAGVEGVLRVLVTASPTVRAKRLAAAQGLSAGDAAEAVAASDRDRRDYFQRFYQIKDELPTHYDLAINTDVITPEQGAQIILAAARSGG